MMTKLAQNIRNRRIELRMSQQELADKLGYRSRSAINKIELGINDLTQPKIIAFAEALQTTPAYLMGWENEPLSITKKVGELTQHEEKVVLAYRDKPAIQPAVDKLLDVSPSEEPEILKAAARNGRPVPPEVIQELIDKVDTLPDFVD